MISRLSVAAVAALASFSHAWLPDSTLLDKRGFSLFERNVTDRDVDANGKRWMPESGRIRGVNLGSLFVVEPWMVPDEWNNMGCGGQASEFDCVMNTGQARSDAAFQRHWDTFITEADLNEMVAYSINTIRIPIGYWMYEALVDNNSEHWPRVTYTYCPVISKSNVQLYRVVSATCRGSADGLATGASTSSLSKTFSSCLYSASPTNTTIACMVHQEPRSLGTPGPDR